MGVPPKPPSSLRSSRWSTPVIPASASFLLERSEPGGLGGTPINNLNVHCSGKAKAAVQASRHSGTLVFRYSGIQVFRYSGIQVFRYSGIQVFRYSGVKALRYQIKVPRYSGVKVSRCSGRCR